MNFNRKEVAQRIDHTFLKPEGKLSDIEKLCKEALNYNFAAVAIAPDFVEYAAEKLDDTNVDIIVVVGFPFGFNTTDTKVFEAREGLKKGATEVDMVVNISGVKDCRWDHVKNDIRKVGEITGDNILKVIFETCYLTKSEIKELAKICREVKQVDYIKTSTGFGSQGATLENVKLMKKMGELWFIMNRGERAAAFSALQDTGDLVTENLQAFLRFQRHDAEKEGRDFTLGFCDLRYFFRDLFPPLDQDVSLAVADGMGDFFAYHVVFHPLQGILGNFAPLLDELTFNLFPVFFDGVEAFLPLSLFFLLRFI